MAQNQMNTEPRMKRDVIVFSAASGQVVSIADFYMDEHESLQFVRRLNDNLLHDHLMADAVETATVGIGQYVEVDEGRLNRLLTSNPVQVRSSNNTAFKAYCKRKANCVCVRCESPQLETDNFCAECAQKNRERVLKNYYNDRTIPD